MASDDAPEALADLLPAVRETVERGMQRARERQEQNPEPSEEELLEQIKAQHEARRQRVESAFGRIVWPRYRDRYPLTDQLRRWVERTADRASTLGLYMTGPVGTGKTQAAWDVLRAMMLEPGWEETSVDAWAVPDLLDALRPRDDSEHRDLLNGTASVDLLLLDDLGAERASEWTLERLYVILSRRYNHCLPTIITSNLAPGEIGPYLGERMASRLAEMCQVVAFTGVDHRRCPA